MFKTKYLKTINLSWYQTEKKIHFLFKAQNKCLFVNVCIKNCNAYLGNFNRMIEDKIHSSDKNN